MKHRFLFFACMLMAPSFASAIDLGAGANIYSVSKHCWCGLTNGLMLTPQQLNEAQSQIIGTLRQSTEALYAQQKKHAQSIVNNWNQFVEGMKNFLKNERAAKLANDYLQNTSAINQPTNICDRDDMANQVNDTEHKGHLAGGRIKHGITDSHRTTSSARSRIEQIAEIGEKTRKDKQPVVTSSSLFDPEPPPSGEEHLQDYIGVLTATEVPIELKDEDKKNSAGQASLLLQNIFALTSGLAQDQLTKIGVHHLPVNDGSVYAKQWKEAGQEGLPPGYKEGKISMNGILQTEVASRYANKNWYQSISTQETHGLLREQTLMMAVQMRQVQHRLEMIEAMVAQKVMQAGLSFNQDSNRELGQLTATIMSAQARE